MFTLANTVPLQSPDLFSGTLWLLPHTLWCIYIYQVSGL